MKRVSIVFFFILFLAGTIFAQPDKDKVVKLHGKKYYVHIVAKGETVYGISKDFNLGVKDIVLNNPKAMDGISPGDTLQIPFSVPAAVSANADARDTVVFIYHKVEPKETLYSFCKQYKVKMELVDSLNPELHEKGMRAGMTLRIPNPNAPVVSSYSKKADSNSASSAYKNLISGLKPTADTGKPAGVLLKRYNIALMLTFSPQEVDSVQVSHLVDGTQQLPLLVQIAADFYSGIKMALDSLAMQGFDADLHVYNVPPDSAGRTLDSLLALPTMASSNLIIGPPYPSLFCRVAKYAMQHQIPIVSPLSSDNSVLKNNPFTSKTVPSPMTQIEQTADYIAMHHREDNIIIIRNTDAVNDNFFDVFKKRINTTLSIINSSPDSILVANYTDDLDDIGKEISGKKYNVIVVPYQGASFVPKLVNQLANSDYNNDDSLCIFGMQNWSNMDVLDPNNLDTLHLHYASNEYIDHNNHAVARFIQKYRSQYSSIPLYYAYQGFDLAYYYCTLLKKYGTALQAYLPTEKYKGIHTSFDFYKPEAGGGFENKAIYMLEYKNYSVVRDSL